MEINTVVVGNLDTNCYILKKDNNILVIDPGDDIDKINQAVGDNKVVGVLITHNHSDHVGAISHFDKDIIYDYNNLDEKEYNIANFKFKAIYTPGHTSDSISYYFKSVNSLFCGDFIFYKTIGRCDLPTGNFEIMNKSINKIKKYPKDMIIYPGHGKNTILEYEIENNIYFR